jgi:A/G-specific adenine glycosylase
LKLDAQITELLLAWYAKNARDLPLRRQRDPYGIWVSEIMLQQTRVDTVMPYYERFLQQAPDIETLAGLEEQKLLKLWEGLGYYSRARNLQKAARQVMALHGGVFPDTFESIRGLAGIGDYTAGAIASIAFDRPTPAVDGNVLRVVARVTATEQVDTSPMKKMIAAALAAIYPRHNCGDFTQALMELGATVCLPNGAPKCSECPLRQLCRAHQKGDETRYPLKKEKAARRREQLTIFIVRNKDCIALCRRPQTGLLRGMWALPHVAGHLSLAQAEQQLAVWDVAAQEMLETRRRKHIFTHIEWDMVCYRVRCRNQPAAFLWIGDEQLRGQYALPTAFKKCLTQD